MGGGVSDPTLRRACLKTTISIYLRSTGRGAQRMLVHCQGPKRIGVKRPALQIPICRTDTKGALLYGLNPYVRSVRLNSSVPCGNPCVKIGVTTFVTPFAYLTVLRTPRESGAFFLRQRKMSPKRAYCPTFPKKQ